MPKKQISNPKLSVVALSPNEKKQISNLSDRLQGVIVDYVENEKSNNRVVTVVELVGTIDMLKDFIKNEY